MTKRNDNPEWTDNDFKRAKRMHELPDSMTSALRKVGRPKAEKPKKQITLRLSADIVEHLKKSEAYMAKIETLLRNHIDRGKL